MYPAGAGGETEVDPVAPPALSTDALAGEEPRQRGMYTVGDTANRAAVNPRSLTAAVRDMQRDARPSLRRHFISLECSGC